MTGAPDRPLLAVLVDRLDRYRARLRGALPAGWRGSRGRHRGRLDLDDAFLRRLERLTIATRGATKGGLIGDHLSSRRAASLEFADYRRYNTGDDLRRIDWNVYGRLETLFVKLTEARQDTALHLLLDCSQSMDWGEPNKLLYAKQLTAALGYSALAHFDSVTVTAFGDRLHERFPLTRGKGQALALIGFLNSIDVGGTTDISSALTAYCVANRRPGVAVLVSDLLAPGGYDSGLLRLASAGLEVNVVHLLHRHELHPDLGGEMELTDVETGEVVEITVGPEALRAYEERVARWCERAETFCSGHGIGYVLVDTSAPVEQLVLRQLRQRRLLR